MFTIMIMTLAMSATSVMAESLKKIPVTAESQVFWINNSDPDFRNDLNNGGVRQWRAVHSKENVQLLIGGSLDPVHFLIDVWMNGRWKTGRDQVNHCKVVWTDDTNEGGFEGVLQWKILYEPPAGPESGTFHGVLQGWGTYEGQKLQLEGFWNGGPAHGPSTWTGFLLTP